MTGERTKAVTAGWVKLVAGVWLLLAPYMMGFSGTRQATNVLVVGTLLGIAGLVRLSMPTTTSWLGWVGAILGLWLIATPFLMGAMGAMVTWNSIIVGLVVAGTSLWSASSSTQLHPRMG